jgi:hypothetical protein
MRSLFFAVFAALCALAVTSAGLAGTAPKPHAKDTPPPANFYEAGGCDTSDLLTSLIGGVDKTKVFYQAPAHAARLIEARISTCHEIILNWRNSVGPAPPPVVIVNPSSLPALLSLPKDHCRPVTTNDPMRAYAMLEYCVTWVNRYVPATLGTPTPAPIVAPTPPDRVTTWNKYIYVLALATDAPTSAQMAYRLRDALAVRPDPPSDAYTERPVQLALVAEPTWTLAMYQQQCFADSSTAGAIVALPPGSQGNTWNAIIQATWTTVAWQTLVLDCEPTNTSYVNNAAFIRWASGVASGKTTAYSVPLASALGVLAGVLALTPARNVTYAVASPMPSPQPGHAYQTGYTTSSNSSLAGTAAAVGLAALNPLSTVSLGQGAEADGQVAAAIAKTVPGVARELTAPCATTAPATPPPVQCGWLKTPPP